MTEDKNARECDVEDMYMKKHIVVITSIVLLIAAVLATIFYSQINTYFVINGMPPLFYASHIFILYCTAITLFVVRKSSKALSITPVFILFYTACSYYAAYTYQSCYEMIHSDATGVIPFGFVLGIMFCIGLGYAIYWVFEMTVCQMIQDNVKVTYIFYSAVIVVSMVTINKLNKPWIREFYPKHIKTVIEAAINSKDVNSCNNLSSLYYKWNEIYEPGIEPEDYLYYFPTTSIELCKNATRAVTQHNFKKCDTDKYYDGIENLEQENQSTEEGNEMRQLEIKQVEVTEKYMHMPWECRRIYLNYYPDEEDDLRNFVKHDYRNYYDLGCEWQYDTCPPETSYHRRN